jgi:hypothetical protein
MVRSGPHFRSSRPSEWLIGRVVPAATQLTRQRILKALRERDIGIPLKRLGATDRKIALEVIRRFSPIRHLMSLHTRELLRDYHRKGLLDTPIAVRDPRDVVVRMNPAERELYDAVEEYIGTTYNNAAQDQRAAVGFVMTIYRRRLARPAHIKFPYFSGENRPAGLVKGRFFMAILAETPCFQAI